jgi:copper chaperone CopZ
MKRILFLVAAVSIAACAKKDEAHVESTPAAEPTATAPALTQAQMDSIKADSVRKADSIKAADSAAAATHK